MSKSIDRDMEAQGDGVEGIWLGVEGKKLNSFSMWSG